MFSELFGLGLIVLCFVAKLLLMNHKSMNAKFQFQNVSVDFNLVFVMLHRII